MAQDNQGGGGNVIARPNSFMAELFSGSPEAQQALMQIGLSMVQPQQAGTTFGQNVITSMADGMNFLQNLEATRAQQEMEQRELAAREGLAAAQAGNLTEDTRLKEREMEQRDVANAIDLFGVQSDLAKAQMTLQGIAMKVAKEPDPEKKVVLEGLMKIIQAKASVDGTFDFNEMMLMTNMVEAGWIPAQNPDLVKWSGSRFVIDMGMLEEPDEKTGANKVRFMAVSPDTLRAIGLNPDAIRGRDQALIDAETKKGVVEKSEAQPRRDAEGKILIGDQKSKTTPAASASTSSAATTAGGPPGQATNRQQLLEQKVAEGQARSQQRKLTRKEKIEFIKEQRVAMGIVGGIRAPGNAEKIQKFYRESFDKLTPAEQEQWIAEFASGLTPEMLEEARSKVK